jgi:hypothetical protein
VLASLVLKVSCTPWRFMWGETHLQIPKVVLWTWTGQGNAEGCAGWTGGWWGHCECAEPAINTHRVAG